MRLLSVVVVVVVVAAVVVVVVVVAVVVVVVVGVVVVAAVVAAVVTVTSTESYPNYEGPSDVQGENEGAGLSLTGGGKRSSGQSVHGTLAVLF